MACLWPMTPPMASSMTDSYYEYSPFAYFRWSSRRRIDVGRHGRNSKTSVGSIFWGILVQVAARCASCPG